MGKPQLLSYCLAWPWEHPNYCLAWYKVELFRGVAGGTLGSGHERGDRSCISGERAAASRTVSWFVTQARGQTSGLASQLPLKYSQLCQELCPAHHARHMCDSSAACGRVGGRVGKRACGRVGGWVRLTEFEAAVK